MKYKVFVQLCDYIRGISFELIVQIFVIDSSYVSFIGFSVRLKKVMHFALYLYLYLISLIKVKLN